MEYCAGGRFVDRASQLFWFRRQPLPQFETRRDDKRLEIITEHLHLIYDLQMPFSAHSLQVRLLGDGSETIWRYGDVDEGNLLGTCRTLDRVDGSTALEPGLLSRSGWSVVDDSHSLVFDDQGWLRPRPGQPESADIYFFGYGRDFARCLADFRRVAGRVPLIPRWALGNWWSRYWAYTQAELTSLMEDFRAHEVPLAVCIVDMDWHLVDIAPGINGWTGYTWNRELFPDPPAFIAWLHEHGLKTALNLHPALGVRPHEAMYSEMARHVGVDPETKATVAFDIADPAFAHAYFEVLHHPQEAHGVDFWWLDWQQGEASRMPGLDPLFWLNHLHFHDLGRDGRKRPFIFSRWGGLGNHRTPIGFSGDTHVTWDSLAFQPYFTATAANVGYGWWSHDIGGHMYGQEDRELYTRWVQFGVFSPIFRLHCTNNPFHERRPWGYDPEVFTITREAMQLRHALIPYLYTMAWRDHAHDQPLIRPLYHDYPQQEAAYNYPGQYSFGTELIVAPVTAAADPDTKLNRQTVWLPPGTWFDFFSGEQFDGDRQHVAYARLRDVPVYARAGAIIPLGPRVGWGGVENPGELFLHLFAGANNYFELYEDDGETSDYTRGAHVLTPMTQRWQGQEIEVDIGPAAGETALVPRSREISLLVHGLVEPDQVSIHVDGRSLTRDISYDARAERVEIAPIRLGPAQSLAVSLRTGQPSLLSRRDRRREKLLAMLAGFTLPTAVKTAVAACLDDLMAGHTIPAGLARDLTLSQQMTLQEIARRRAVI